MAEIYNETTIADVTVRARGPRFRGAEDLARVPTKEPYVFDSARVEELSIAVEHDLNVLLTGPKGCGKTSLPMQLAARLGHPVVRFNCDGETRVAHLRGQQRPASSEGVLTLQYHHGLLADAMRNGWWVVADEIDAATAPVLFVLMPVLEAARALQIPETGEQITPHPAFRFFATANTAGVRSRARGRYAGTTSMNEALLDRFAMVINVDYPGQDAEVARVVARVPELAEVEINGPRGKIKAGLSLIQAMVKTAAKLRSDEKFSADFSSRQVVQWAQLAFRFPVKDHMARKELPFDVLRAAQLSVLNKMESPTDRKTAYEAICRIFEYPETKASKSEAK